MVEVHAAVIAMVIFSFIAMVCFCVVAKFEMAIAHDDVKFWRQQYEMMNDKMRPAFVDAAENLVPMTTAAHDRLEKLRQALETEGD